MSELKNEGFSDEIIMFSKIIDKALAYVSKDVVALNEINKGTDKLHKATKTDIDKLKQEVADLRNIISNVRASLVEMDKKVKKRNSVIQEQARPIKNNKEELRALMSEMADMKLSIKNIEQKLKIN